MKRLLWMAAQIAVFTGGYLALWLPEWHRTGGNPDPRAHGGAIVAGLITVIAFATATLWGSYWLGRLRGAIRMRRRHQRPDERVLHAAALPSPAGRDNLVAEKGAARPGKDRPPDRPRQS